VAGLIAVFTATKGKTQTPPDGKAAVTYAERLARREKALVEAAAAAKDEKEKLRIVSDALGLATEAADADEYALAQRLVGLANSAARGARDTDLATDIAKVKRQLATMESAYQRAKAALEKLSSDPDDAEANAVAGLFFTNYKGNWDGGLPLLAKGNDPAAQRAAKTDLAAPSEPAGQIAAGDLWWTLAQEASGLSKAHLMLRARHWYKAAMPGLAESARERLRTRVEQIDRYALSFGLAVDLALETIAEDSSGGKLTPYQRARVQQLLTDYRRAGATAAQRDQVVAKLFNIGGAAVSQLLAQCNKQLQPQLRKYGELFQQQAASLAASRAGRDNIAEVQRLRAQVLALKERPDLTKEMIVAEGDPAMAKLQEILVVNRDQIFQRSARLREERKKLAGWGQHWERCSQYLVTQMISEGSLKPSDAPKPNFEQYLTGEEDLAAKMAMPMDEAAKAALAENRKLIGNLDAEEGRAILACNLMRQLLGLSVLKIDLKLCDAARDHSADMRKLNFFAHESPVAGKKTPWDRAKNFGTSASGENIAMGYADGNAANLGWFHSPGHHKNMLGNHRRIGLGVSGQHYTEMFGN
jgi:uncharacterized protein YkwD